MLILTMPHVLHFARRLQTVLAEAGIAAELSDNDRATQGFTIFAFAPQNFPASPPIAPSLFRSSNPFCLSLDARISG